MLRNFLKIAVRNLLKHRFISFINLFGLTVGLTCCLLITTYILNELSFDKYNKNADNIYRVTRSFNNDNGVVSLTLSTISPPFGYYFPSEFPQIKKMTRLMDYGGAMPARYKDKIFNQRGLFFADENLFDVFSVKVFKGNPQTALTDPFSIMLTEENAKKYFGDEDPMNKVIRFNSQFDCKVTGIYKAFPSNAHMHPGVLLSFNTLKDSAVYGEKNLQTNWGNNSFFTYLLLPENYKPETLVSLFPAFLDKHNDIYPGKTASKLTKLGLQKLTDIHLKSHTDYEAEANGDMSRVYIFSAIALFILLIACINYMNLSTARSALRAKEIGIRKVIGARKKELVTQFLGESVMICLVAIIIAAVLTWLTIPWLNKVSGQELSFSTLLQVKIIIPLLLTPFIIGIISGLYPALFMSSFQPVKTLKGLFKVGGGSISFRKVLVVAQFAIGIILIITTFIVFQQLHYIQSKSLGFDKDRIVTMNYTNEVSKQYESFRTELLQNSAFKDVSRSSRIPSGRLLDNMGASAMNGDSLQPVVTDIKYVNTDYDFASTFGMQLASGRYFARNYGTDTLNYVLNQSAVKAIGWKTDEEAVGKGFKYGGVSGHIIGVLKDFHFESMHQPIVPMVFIMLPPSNTYFNNLSVKIGGGNTSAAMSAMERTWKKYFPETPFEYTFLDDNFDKLYQSEQRQATIFTSFACIAIFIACLGLFGLSAFAISQRVKEIGVRKVLGANTSTIVGLLSKDFLKLVAVAAIIAFPIAWYAMNSWLKDFAYRISIQWWVFIVAGLVAGLIAFVTVSFQAIKAALANPVKSLRSE
ncbi:MAG: FtsX-like permease family protein [Bacteroidota bacterium]